MNFSINCEHRGVRCTAVCAGSNPPQTVESGEKVLVGLVMGVVFGLALHTIYGSDSRYLKILYSGLTLLVTAMFNCCK